MLRFLSGGESHGPSLTAILDGFPAGLKIDFQRINRELSFRQGGYGRGKRQEIEKDEVIFKGGVRGGITLGSPIVMEIKNQDWENWKEVMAWEETAHLEEKVVSRPRPGHADLAGAIKYKHKDIRNVLERASARETAVRVAVGALCEELLEQFKIYFASHVIAIGKIELKQKLSFAQIKNAVNSPLYCADEELSQKMIEEIDRAKEEGESLGGVFEVVATGLPIGLGSYSQWDLRLDGLLSQAVMSIPAVKGVEIGEGFSLSRLTGSQAADPIFYDEKRGFYRQTNYAGGIEGGMTNGEMLWLRGAMKPIPTLRKPLVSVDLISKKEAPAAFERSDICAVPAASRVAKAMVAFVLARALLEKIGGDSLAEQLKRYELLMKEQKSL